MRKFLIASLIGSATLAASALEADAQNRGNGQGHGNGYGRGNGGGGGGGPLPVLGLTILGQAVGGVGLYALWRRRRKDR